MCGWVVLVRVSVYEYSRFAIIAVDDFRRSSYSPYYYIGTREIEDIVI